MAKDCDNRASEIDLAGVWTLSGTGEDGASALSLPASVPGDVQSALFAAGLLADPRFGDNELRAQWPGQRGWTLSRSFDIAPSFLENDSIILRLEDCDTFCSLSINGHAVGETADRFLRYDFEVRPFLRPGRNEIAAAFRSPEAVADERKAHYSFPYRMANVKENLRDAMSLIRKPACHGGWDWGLAQMAIGLCGPVRLVATSLARIDYVWCEQEFQPSVSNPQSCNLHLTVEVFASKAGAVPFEVSLDGQTLHETASLQQGAGKVSFTLSVENPRLWWPAGEGEQYLHDLRVATPDSAFSRRIGFRTVRLVNEPSVAPDGEEELSFEIEVNGRRIFCKGANWIPCDAFDSLQEAKYAPLLRAMRDCNMNMVRLWGGGQFERDSFYDLCDELGIMVFHDLMFGCAAYPVDSGFMALVEAETRHQVRRLRDRACIALWAGDNECIGSALGCHFPMGVTGEETRRLREHYVWCWRARTARLAALMQELDPTRAFWPSSPCDGLDDPARDYNRPRKGDFHTYDSWEWLETRPRFCAEYGYQSYPSKEVALSFVKPSDLDPSNPLFAYHQKSPYWNDTLRSGIELCHKSPPGGLAAEDQLYLSLSHQARMVRRATEAWRSQMPHCMGTLIWQLNDNWPVASWSMVEYGGKWKPLMYEARRFFAPVAAFVTSPRKGETILTAINDTPEPVDAEVTLRLMDFGGATLRAETFPARLAPRTATRLGDWAESAFGSPGDLRRRFLAVDILMVRHASSVSRTRTYQTGWLFDTFANLEIAAANVAMRPQDILHGDLVVELSTDKPAFCVWVEAAGIAGEFDDNHFTLLPGEPRTLRFTPRDPSATSANFARSLTVSHIANTFFHKP